MLSRGPPRPARGPLTMRLLALTLLSLHPCSSSEDLDHLDLSSGPGGIAPVVSDIKCSLCQFVVEDTWSAVVSAAVITPATLCL